MIGLPFLLSFYLFLGINIGALTAFVLYKIPKLKAQHLYFLCGFVLIALLVLELIPHATQEYGLISVLFGASLGVLICLFLHGLFERLSPSKAYQPSLFIIVGIAVHNIPAGLAIGTALDNELLSASFIAALLLHQIPEGLAIMASLLLSVGERLPFLLFFITSILLSGTFLVFSNIGQSMAVPLRFNGVIFGIAIGFLLFTALWDFLLKKHS
ncbi:ZIP family metal transporter [Domibacillus epiphyticus]|uniref:Zinc/iron permease n=1 Tax=Domibacillus epiphyticus TaxID=1714355 RepID=A0A1V2A3P9_9BACI|nr:ZIP family metal transporter [Domibacillus epiphyticus]OMP65636.1 hypothetical protein BTO28_16435 [Domibacillus epiphyticus]